MKKDLSYEDMYEKFYEIYHSKIRTEIGQFEAERKELLEKHSSEFGPKYLIFWFYTVLLILFTVQKCVWDPEEALFLVLIDVVVVLILIWGIKASIKSLNKPF